MLAKTQTTALTGVSATLVRVEANVGAGLPGTFIVGLADASISESRERIKTACVNSQLGWPKTKVIISLSPASLRKSGSHYDLAMTVAVQAAHGRELEVLKRSERTVFLGEVALDGTLVRVNGVVPSLMAVLESSDAVVIIPRGNLAEASLLDSSRVLVAEHLGQVMSWLRSEITLPCATGEPVLGKKKIPDMKDVVGQPQARCAAEVAAVGGHHMLMIGPPGSGKSMIAERLPGILPALSPQQRIEATAVNSVAGRTFDGPVLTPPFVAPHHSVTRAALLGGGAGNPLPGAISLAHHGVLFLDEVSEIPASILDTLRTPLEHGKVRMVRSKQDVTFPARFQLILAANPCRCGAEHVHDCTCTSSVRAHYLANLSGPLRDRIDMRVSTHARGAILSGTDEEPSSVIAERVAEARLRSLHRWSQRDIGGYLNGAVDPHRLRRECPADDQAMAYLTAFLAHGRISQRGVDRALKLAWSLCDIEAGTKPNLDHVARALDLRGVDSLERAA